MNSDLAEQLERLGAAILSLAAEVKANAQVGADVNPEARLRQIELTQGALELLASLLPKEKPRDDEADCEAAVAVIRKTRRASVSHFQRQLGWGHNRAARILGLLQSRGIVGARVGEQSYEILKDGSNFLRFPLPVFCRPAFLSQRTPKRRLDFYFQALCGFFQEV